jgi:hypothetical protein
MSLLKGSNLALAFLLELCLLAALAFWGFRAGNGPLARAGLGIGAPLLMAVLWGILMAPRAPVQLPGALHLALALVLFGLGVAALFAAGQLRLAVIFAVAIVLNQLLLALWHQ